MAEKRDKWSKTEIVIQAVASILLPIVIGVIGGIYSFYEKTHNEAVIKQEKESQQKKENADRITNLLIHLASTNDKERLLTVRLTEHLANEGQLPGAIVPVLVEIAKGDQSSEVAKAAGEVVNETTTVAEKVTNPDSNNLSPIALLHSAKEKLASLPARIYIHIRDNNQKEKATNLAALLELNSDYRVPGIIKTDQGPSNNQLRYFSQNDKPEVDKIIQTLGNSIKVSPIDLSSSYKDSTAIRPRHYELWFSANGL